MQNPQNGCQFNEEIDLWMKMVDSMANVITASTTLVQLMHHELALPVNQEEYHKKRSCQNTVKFKEKMYLPEPPGVFQRRSRCLVMSPTDFLDEQYYLTKQAITKRYRPQNRITTLFVREVPTKDTIMNDISADGLYRISNTSSEGEISATNFLKYKEFYEMNRTGSSQNTTFDYEIM